MGDVGPCIGDAGVTRGEGTVGMTGGTGRAGAEGTAGDVTGDYGSRVVALEVAVRAVPGVPVIAWMTTWIAAVAVAGPAGTLSAAVEVCMDREIQSSHVDIPAETYRVVAGGGAVGAAAGKGDVVDGTVAGQALGDVPVLEIGARHRMIRRFRVALLASCRHIDVMDAWIDRDILTAVGPIGSSEVVQPEVAPGAGVAAGVGVVVKGRAVHTLNLGWGDSGSGIGA